MKRLTVFITTFLVLGAGCTSQPATLSYLVSTSDSLKYCNGANMDSEGFRRTLTEVVETDISTANLSQTDQLKTVLHLATKNTCQIVVDQSNFTIKDGVLNIPPFGAWAGVSITMCSCKPIVEENAKRIPGITRVEWEQ